MASFELNAGEPVEGILPSLIEELDAYDEPLVPMGLGKLASTRARSIWYISSPERSPYGPSNPKKARLTYSLLRSVKALTTLGGIDIDELKPNLKLVATKTKRLAQTLVTIAVAHPEKIYLPGFSGESERFIDENAEDSSKLWPVEIYTRTQAEGLQRLRPFWETKSMRPYADKVEAIINSAEALPVIDTDMWNSQLRRERLGMWTAKERQDYIDFLRSARVAARERAIQAGYTEKDFRIPDPF